MPTARHSPDEQRALVASWRSSGLSQSRFALEHGVPQSSFSKWVARYTPGPMALPTFATVEVIDEAPPPPNLVVHLGCTGLRVEVPAGFDAAELRRLVGALC
jgi:transposase-like protein